MVLLYRAAAVFDCLTTALYNTVLVRRCGVLMVLLQRGTLLLIVTA